MLWPNKMQRSVLLDNDVILKACCYRLGEEALACTALEHAPPSALGVARFVLRDRIARSQQLSDREEASKALAAFMESIRFIEPTDEEAELAAEFEAEAQARALEFDTGESQLFAVLLRRQMPLLVTGDKRAIGAMEQIAPNKSNATACIACIEQLIAAMVARFDIGALRIRICREPYTDRAISNCFSCSTTEASEVSIREGLRSYTNDVRKSAPTMLLPSDDLSALVA